MEQIYGKKSDEKNKLTEAECVKFVATQSQQTGRGGPRPKDDRRHGLLFARGYNDRLLLREGQLDNWLHYLADNPRRLILKREHHNERTTISRNQCLSLNDMARILCEPLDLPPYRCKEDAGER